MPDPNGYERYVEAIRRGGFHCFIPVVLGADCPEPQLDGFPATICYTGLSDNSTHTLPDLVTACYWCDPQSYYEDGEIRRLTYRSTQPNPYRVELIYNKSERSWSGRKYRGDKVVLWSAGVELKRFIVQTTGRGLDKDEPAQPRLTCEDTASVGVFIFTPSRETTTEVSA